MATAREAELRALSVVLGRETSQDHDVSETDCENLRQGREGCSSQVLEKVTEDWSRVASGGSMGR